MKRWKMRIHTVLLAACMLLMMVCPVCANEDSVRVYDYADLLTDEEEKELNERCRENEAALETELYILTTNDTGGKKTVEYADDFGDEHAFGYNEPYGNYMILCIDMQNRIVWLSTSGKAEMYFTEARIDALLDDVYPSLSAGEYYDTCYAYIESGEKYLSKEPVVNDVTTDPNRYQDTMYVYDEAKGMLDFWYIRLGISALIGIVAVAVMSLRAGTRMTASGRTYSRGNAQIHNRTDAFVRRTTTQRKIETSSSGGSSRSGGGGGHHTSSGGHSHGGGGRSF